MQGTSTYKWKTESVLLWTKKKNEKEKKSQGPPVYKNVKYDSKVKEAHFTTVKNHSDIDSRTNTLHKMFFYTPSLKLLEMNIS